MWVFVTPVAVPIAVKISLRGQNVFHLNIGEWTQRLTLWQTRHWDYKLGKSRHFWSFNRLSVWMWGFVPVSTFCSQWVHIWVNNRNKELVWMLICVSLQKTIQIKEDWLQVLKKKKSLFIYVHISNTSKAARAVVWDFPSCTPEVISLC